MKIAVIASGKGEKILHLYEFFKEGNRIEIDSILTDNPEAEIAQRLKAEGVEVIPIVTDSADHAFGELLKSRDVELLVVDDFKGELPHELKEAFGKAIVYPQGVASSPLEVIEAGKKLNAPAEPAAAHQPAATETSTPAEKGTASNSIEEEWAEVLEIKIDETPIAGPSPEGSSPEEPSPENVTNDTTTPPPVPTQPHGHHYQHPQPNRASYGQGMPAPENNREPMPNTYLVWSVIITILCCLIPGVIAIVFSASVSSKYYAGDIEGAKRASRNAQIWCIVSIIAGIVWATLYLPLTLFL